jgi:type II secretory pathway component PulK
MMLRRRHKAHGIALIAVLMAVIIVGAAMAALTSLISSDGFDTLNQNNQSQLQQLLLAGAADASAHLTSAAPTAGQSWQTELPDSLNSEGATLQSHVESLPSDGQQAVLVIRARFNQRTAEQTLRYNRDGSGWKLASAELAAG